MASVYLRFGRVSLPIWRTFTVLCILTAGCSSEATKRRDATSAYWAELSRISTQFDAAGKALGKPTTPAATIEMSERFDKLCRQLSDEIAQLPLSFVDAEVVALGADYIQTSNDLDILMQDMANVMKRQAQLETAAGSASVALESLVRGFLGDPLGKVKEFTAASQNLSDEGAKILARWAAIQQRAAAFDAREVKLRSALSEKYRRDFPPLTPPHKPD